MTTEEALGQVEDIVRKYARIYAARYPRNRFDDLEQEGRIAALKAIRKWNPEGGKSWRTYAGWAIRIEIMKAAWEQGNAIGPRFATVVSTLARTGEGTKPTSFEWIDDPDTKPGRALVATESEGPTPAQMWAVTAALRRTKAAHALAFLLYHRCGMTIYEIADEIGCSHESARQYEKAARRDVEVSAARLEWRAAPGACPGWGGGTHAHGAPISSLGLCPNCWAAINQTARIRRAA